MEKRRIRRININNILQIFLSNIFHFRRLRIRLKQEGWRFAPAKHIVEEDYAAIIHVYISYTDVSNREIFAYKFTDAI